MVTTERDFHNKRVTTTWPFELVTISFLRPVDLMVMVVVVVANAADVELSHLQDRVLLTNAPGLKADS